MKLKLAIAPIITPIAVQPKAAPALPVVKRKDYSVLLASEVTACDTETTGLNGWGSIIANGFYPARPFAFSFTTYDIQNACIGENFYFRFNVDPYTRRVKVEDHPVEYAILKAFYENPNTTKVFHNANFDIGMLGFIGIEVKGRIVDTMILAHINNNSHKKYGLKELCVELFPGQFPVDDQTDLIKSVNQARLKGKKLGYCIATHEHFGQEPNKADYWLGEVSLCEVYALRDTDRTIALYMAFEDQYRDDEVYRSLVDMEHELQSNTRAITARGMKIDMFKVKELTTYYQEVIDQQLKIKAKLGFASLNPDSSKQMQAAFYGKGPGQLGLKEVYKSRKGKDAETVTLDGDVLEMFKNQGVPLATCLIELNAANNQLNDFIIPFQKKSTWEEGYKVLRSNLRNVGPATGRLAGSDPNLMNISKSTSFKKKSEVDYRCREPFSARPGYVLYAFDYSQIEVYTVAFTTKEEFMIKMLLEGLKIHDASALKFFGHKEDFDKTLYPDSYDMYRNKAKMANFSIFYGVGAKKLATYLGIDYYEARAIIEGFYELYPGIQEFLYHAQNDIYEKGYCTDVFGRKYYLDERFAYKCLNYCAGQGPAAGVMKRAVNNVSRLFRDKWHDCYILQLVHDEIIMEVNERAHSKALIKDILSAMQGDFHTYFGMPHPFKVEPSLCYPNWAKKEKLEV